MRRFTVRETRAMDCLRRETASRLARLGYPVTLGVPNTAKRYLHFSVGSGPRKWEGYVDVIPWLASVAPQWAGLASMALSEERLLALFAALPVALDKLTPWCDTGMVAGLAVQNGTVLQREMIRLPCNETVIYADALPLERVPVPCCVGVAQIPLKLIFTLGYSELALARITRLVAGDILLIQHRTQQVRCHDHTLYTFSINEEEVVMQPFVEEPAAEDTSVAADRINRIPLQLDFVLHQTTLSVEALSQLSCGHVFALEPQAERRVLIRVNRQSIGRGELVDVDGRLGVEVNELYLETRDAE